MSYNFLKDFLGGQMGMIKFKHGFIAGMVSCSLLISSPALAAIDTNTLQDISNHWAYDQITTIHNQGLLFPLKEDLFLPNKEMTRAEFVSMITKTLQAELDGDMNQPFADVPLHKWYAADLVKAKKAGLILGGDDGFFRPEDPISRAELAVLVQRAYPSLKNHTTIPTYFSDVASHHWASKEIKHVTQAGIIKGYTDNTYKPNQNVTRAEAVVLISRLLTKENKPEPTSIASVETVKEASLPKYTVQSGDSLWKISQKYGVQVDSLIEINQLQHDQLQIGQALYLTESTSIETISEIATLNAESSIASNETSNTTTSEVELLEWSVANTVFAIGKTSKVTDVNTGKTFHVQRNYGANHADVEPLTVEDTNTMNAIWGGPTWNTRPVIVEVDGRRLAAAMHNMPHDVQKITNNNYNGHTCIHFLGSTKHKDGQAWEAMQHDVQIAATYKL